MQNLHKNTPILRFSEFCDEWEEKKLGDIAKVAMCKRIFKHETLPTGEIPFYKIGTFGKHPDAYLSQKKYEEYKQKYSFPKKGDILLSASGTIGRQVIYDGKPAYFQDSNIVWIDHNEKNVINTFLNYLYSNIKWVTDGSTINRLYNNNLLNTKIIFPSIKEQQKITSFLSKVDGWIENLRKQKKALEQYKKGMIQKIFPSKGGQVSKIRFKNENGKDFPEWKKTELREVATFSKGEGLSKDDILPNGQHECIHYGELFTRYKELADMIISRTNKQYSKLSEPNDVLMPTSDVTPRGLATATALCKSGVTLGGDILIIRSKVINNLFLSYYIRANKKDIMRLVNGVTVYHIYASDLANLVIMFPDSKEQQKIVGFLTSLDKIIESKQEQINLAENWKKGLMQQMFV